MAIFPLLDGTTAPEALLEALATTKKNFAMIPNVKKVKALRDATAAAKSPEGDGYLAALTNFRFMANAVWSTDEAVERVLRKHA